MTEITLSAANIFWIGFAVGAVSMIIAGVGVAAFFGIKSDNEKKGKE